MSQQTHKAEKELKIAKGLSYRYKNSHPYVSDAYRKKELEAEINLLKSKENDRVNEELSKQIWGY